MLIKLIKYHIYCLLVVLMAACESNSGTIETGSNQKVLSHRKGDVEETTRISAVILNYQSKGYRDPLFSTEKVNHIYDLVRLKIVAPDKYAGRDFFATVQPSQESDRAAYQLLNNEGATISFSLYNGILSPRFDEGPFDVVYLEDLRLEALKGGVTNNSGNQ